MKRLGLYSVIVCLIGFLAVSCNDDDDDSTFAQVLVKSETNQPIAGATVILECQSSINKLCEIRIEGVSNENGVFETRRDLSQILRIESYKVVFDTIINGIPPDTTLSITRDSICGESFINIVEGETSRQTVVLYSCN